MAATQLFETSVPVVARKPQTGSNPPVTGEEYLTSASKIAGTEPTKRHGEQVFVREPEAHQNVAPLSLHHIKSLDAIVSGFGEVSVNLRCGTPDGSVEIELPISFIPLELRKYGQPVRLSVGRQHGYRAPLIEARARVNEPEFEDQTEIDEWFAGL